jgi:predicted SAM-dependent methyltransferase
MEMVAFAHKEELKKVKELLKSSKEKVKNLSAALKKASASRDIQKQVCGLQDRRLLLANVLQGEGIEIGALHHPLPVSAGVKVRYVDYKTREQNIKNHPELDASKIVETDFVCNGELLEIIPDESQDFVIANHMVEHCINPLGTIQQFVRVLRPGGHIFISLPDKRYTFDVLRPISPFSNPADDYRTDRKKEPLETYLEFCRCAQDEDGHEAYEKQTNIHFHAWTQGEIIELFVEARRTFNMPLEIELAARNGIEFIILLRKEIPESYDRAGIVSRERQQAFESAIKV